MSSIKDCEHRLMRELSDPPYKGTLSVGYVYNADLNKYKISLRGVSNDDHQYVEKLKQNLEKI